MSQQYAVDRHCLIYKFQDERVTTIWLDKMLMKHSSTDHNSMRIATAKQANQYVTQSEAGQQVLHQLHLQPSLPGHTPRLLDAL